jgi:uncharacterized surface protein with fasciclin (FAS1) repeats
MGDTETVTLPLNDTLSPTTDEVLTVMDFIASTPYFSTLNELLITAGLVDILQGPGLFTVFAPRNDAFEQLPSGALEALRNDTDALMNVLLYHVVILDMILASELENGAVYPAAQGDALLISTVNDTTIFVNDARVLFRDVFVATNGVVHAIDSVLLPSIDLLTNSPIPSSEAPSTAAPLSAAPSTAAPLSAAPSTAAPQSAAPSTAAPTTKAPTTKAPSTAAPTTKAPVMTASPTSAPIAITIAPSGNTCVNVPGQVVCCPPGQTEGIYFFCRFL